MFNAKIRSLKAKQREGGIDSLKGKLYDVIFSTNNAVSLQKDLDNLASWEKKWQIQFHPNKM